MMKDLTQKKREELEQFLREELIGPGGCAWKYSFDDKDFQDGKEEVINTMPGSIYSTAILFPEKNDDKEESIGDVSTHNDIAGLVELNGNTYDEGETSGEYTDDEYTPSDNIEQSGDRESGIDDDDINSLQRHFPDKFAITCCLNPKVDLSKDVKITISGRYYTKISGADRQKVKVKILEDVNTFGEFWKKNVCLHEYFTYRDSGLFINSFVSDKNRQEVKNIINGINKACAKEVVKKYDVLTDKDDWFIRWYIKEIFNCLNKGEYKTEEVRENYKNTICELEVYENIISYFEELLKLYDNTAFGFWRSHNFCRELPLKEITFDIAKRKEIYSYKDEKFPQLKNIVGEEVKASKKEMPKLSVSLQIIKNNRKEENDNIYLKVLLKNTSVHKKGKKESNYSIINGKVNELCFFGVKIKIESDFIEPYHDINKHLKKDYDNLREENILDFLYRELEDYAVGHFCSVVWTKDNDKVREVCSEFMPSYDVPDVETIPRNKDEYVYEGEKCVPKPFIENYECLQFKWLSTFSDISSDDIITALKEFVGTYKKWIKLQREKVEKTLDLEEIPIAKANLDACEADYQRMMDNIEGILCDNIETFRLMNSAMFMQLWHSNETNQNVVRNYAGDLNEEFYRNIDESDSPAAWRPFQLAFILLNLDGIICHPRDTEWKKRNELVDLVWFPTGGGKTEAYLGLIAFCIINRRRTHKEFGGVTAIMRYTLRLLTIQQFQRALRLIMALEAMRRWGNSDKRYDLGEEISIGLYVGSGSLPNSYNELYDEASKWNDRKEHNDTRIPLDKCPWCGSRLEYSGDKRPFKCTKKEPHKCSFAPLDNPLPVRLCDEAIYENPPTLLFGTVDKFASLAHKIDDDKKSDSRRLFGSGEGINYMPPDMIIQDELHLLLGPLGSAVSLFECAIDELCTKVRTINGHELKVRPKVISSTATTRNTKLQIRALYDRDVSIFPKNGITYDDSFFSFYKREKKDGVEDFVSKRKYIGIMPTGRTQMTTQKRLLAAMHIHRAMFERDYNKEEFFEKVADNYYSVISYYNSLRELGKANASFYTEYPKYVNRLFKRMLRYGKLLECYYTLSDFRCAELSGRLNGTQVIEQFTSIAQNWTLDKRLPYKASQSDQWIVESLPPDTIFATNMISVGLDISRFNTMIVNSMPRNIAEYIQASSRVARETKGIVLTLHNPFRFRDVSHFEKFREFHSKLYYYVEPISITPFSNKAVEKYISLYMATIIRHRISVLAKNADAKNMNESLAEKIKKDIKEYFNKRYERTKELEDDLLKGLLAEEQIEYIYSFVDKAIAQWREMAEETQLVYKFWKPFKKNDELQPQPLFNSPNDYDDAKSNSYWTVPMSLRIVEPEAVLHIKIKNDGNIREKSI